MRRYSLSWRAAKMLKTLISVRLASFFSGMIGKSKDGKVSAARVVLMSLLVAFLLLTFAFFFCSIAASLAIAFVPAGLDSVFFAFMNLMTFSLVFIFSIFETKSQLFDCRDNELLLSMPVRPGDIVISRTLVILILNLSEVMLIMIPSVVMYGIFGGSPLYIATSLVSSLFVGLFATVIASAVGYLVALIASKFKKNSFITLGISVAFLVLYFVGYSALMEGMMMLEEDPDAALSALEGMLAPIMPLGEMSMLSPLPTLLLVAVSVGTAVLAWLIISKNYSKIIVGAKKSGNKKYVASRISAGSAFTAMAKKELRSFFSSATYMLNGAMGAVLEVVFAGFLLISGSELLADIDILFATFGLPTEGTLEVLCTVLLVALTGLNMISASALSMEGKYYWIVKSSPIPTETVLYAKLTPHLLISSSATLISSVLVAVAIGAEPVFWLFLVIAPQIAALVFAVLGLVLNIAMPKLSFENDAQVVKQSMPVFICTIGAMILIPVLLVGAVVLMMYTDALIAAIALTALLLALFVILYLILTGPSKRRLERISV